MGRNNQYSNNNTGKMRSRGENFEQANNMGISEKRE
jgi:hypothetical protein